MLLALTVAATGTRSAPGRFRLRVRSADPARYYLDDARGKSWTPDGALSHVLRGEHHFIARNGFEIDLLSGTCTLMAERGPEYGPFRTSISGTGRKDVTLSVTLRRWINMNSQGWYSGDLHNHRRPEDMPLLLFAEDLNLAQP